jgi:hypothetical protein
MAFPIDPTNGQQATVNGVVYTYVTPPGVWDVTTNFVGGDFTANVINANSVVSTGTLSGTSILGTTLTASGAIAGGSLTSTSTLSVTTTATISSSLAIGATTPSGTAGEIRATNAITAYYSDERLKTNVRRIENALDKIDQLTGFVYTQNQLAEKFGYNDYSDQVGVGANAVQQVQPEACKPAPFDIAEDGSSKSGENYLTVQYERLVPLLIEGIKELRAEIKKLKGE